MLPKEVNILEQVFQKRIKDELSGIKTTIDINKEMKAVLEKNYNKNFSTNFPFRLHYLAFRENGKLRILPVKKVKVIDRNKILLECNAKVKGKVSLISCVYSKFEEEDGFMLVSSLSVEEMKDGSLKVLPNQN